MMSFLSTNIDWLTKVYFGIPGWFGHSLRAAAPVTRVLLFGVVGIPVLAVILLCAYADIHHSILPLHMLVAGAVQFAIETDSTCTSTLPATLDAAIRRLTPEQLEAGEVMFRGSLWVAVLYVALVVWVLFKAVRLIMRQSRGNHG